jgi:hypothetical protein
MGEEVGGVGRGVGVRGSLNGGLFRLFSWIFIEGLRCAVIALFGFIAGC